MKTTIIFLLLLTILLSGRFLFFFKDRPKLTSGNTVTLNQTLLNEPRVRNSKQIFHIEEITVYAAPYPRFRYGDRLKVEGIVEEAEYKSRNNQQIITQLVINNPQITKKGTHRYLAIPAFFRQKVQSTFNQYLPSDGAALLLGILFGYRSDFNQGYYEQLKVTGVLHVVAASGANVSIVGGVLLASFMVFVKRKAALIFTITGILFYALITGFDPPIVRASIMAIIAFMAGGTGRQNTSILALLITAFLMLFMSPQLLTGLSFQLSFLATFGIVAIKPQLDAVLIGRRKPILLEDLTTTLSAQLTTFPILIGSFGSYSPVSILVNLLTLWIIPIVMILGGIACIVCLVWEPLAIPFLYLSYPFLLFFKLIVQLFSSFAQATIVPQLNTLITVGIYLIICALLIKTRGAPVSHKLPDKNV